MKLTEKAFYSIINKNYYNGTYNEGFDIRGDLAALYPVNSEGKIDFENGSKANCTVEWICDDKNLEQILPRFKEEYNRDYNGYTKKEDLRTLDPPRYWNTTYNIIANCMKKTMKVRLWEDTDKVYEFSIE